MSAKRVPRGAMAVMAIAIVCAIWLGGYLSLRRLYNKVETVFTAGVDGDGLGIANDLNERIKLAYNLVTVAKKYLSADDGDIRAVLTARDALMEANGIADKYGANVALTEATTDLYQKMGSLSLTDTDARYRVSLFNDLSSRNDTISHDPYNQMALEYNQALEVFPANILKAVTFSRYAPLFQ